MQQNSSAWLEWRKKGLGASDCPIIMGVSPWKTPYQLWEEKIGISQSVGNFATQRGHDLEPKARANFELEMNADFPETLAVHSEVSIFRASLDGFNKDLNAILEIKCPGKDDHETAKQGKIPEKYWPQMQHQFLVTGAKIGYYYSFDGETGVAVEVKPDIEYISKIIPKLTEFWQFVKTKTPPPMTEKDIVEILDKDLVLLATAYAKLDEKAKEIKKEMDKIKKDLTKGLDHPRTKVGKLTITKSFRAGNVDYKSVPQLEGVDLEEYRKKGTETVTIRIGKL